MHPVTESSRPRKRQHRAQLATDGQLRHSGQLDLAVNDIDVSRFVAFTPAGSHQHERWRVSGVPSPGAKGYSRFNGRSGTLIGCIALTHGGGHAFVLRFDDDSVECFGAHALAPDLSHD